MAAFGLKMKRFLNNFRRRLQTVRQSADFVEVERAERIFYLEFLREGMTVFDVGANVGELTLLFSRFVGERGNVHAFEASREVYLKLETICRAAGRFNVKLNHLALADEKGTVRLNLYDELYSSFNSLAERPLKNYGLELEPVGTEETTATTVDDYCEKMKIERIDLLKIDVEGAELQVLRGAQAMLKSKAIECCAFEFGQTTFDMGNDPSEIEDLLRSCNYKIRNLVAGNPVFPGRERVETAKYSMHIAVPV